MNDDIEILMDKIITFKDEDIPIEKIKMKQSFYDKHNGEHKVRVAKAIDGEYILGVPIDVDDSIQKDYEIKLKTLT